MRHLFLGLLALFSLLSHAQNLSDEEDANLIPESQEKRAHEPVNLPDSRDENFIPSSKEPRQKEEVPGSLNQPVEKDPNQENDPYTDDDNFGSSTR